MTLTVPLSLLCVHWFADFFLQTDWQANNKSKLLKALLRHTSVYSLCFLPWGWKFVLLTFITHTLTDYITSRINSRLWAAGNAHWFFVSVGFDQLIHFATLGMTLQWLA